VFWVQNEASWPRAKFQPDPFSLRARIRAFIPGPPSGRRPRPAAKSTPGGQVLQREKGLFLGQFLMDSGETKCSGFRKVPASRVPSFRFFPALSVPASNFLVRGFRAGIWWGDCWATSGRIPVISSDLGSGRRQLGPQEISGP